MKELIEKRKIQGNRDFAYFPEEALSFLAHIIPAFCVLEENRICHSKINTRNIVYSQRKNRFLLKRLEFSKEIPKENIGLSLIEYIRKESDLFNPPEVKFPSKSEEIKFDPFKFDIWSLAVCLESMVGSHDSRSHPVFCSVINSMKNPQWKSRWDSLKVAQFIRNMGFEASSDISELGINQDLVIKFC